MKIKYLLPAFLLFFLAAFEVSAQKDKKYDPIKAQEAVAEFKTGNPGITRMFDSAYGYVIFHSIGKGAMGVGAASGKGIIYEQGAIFGGSKMSQVTIGFQAGGQEYRQLMFFEDAAAFNRFVSGKFELGAQASAVALTAGVSANAKYTDGIAIFTKSVGGLMYEASVGGQKFKYIKKSKMN